ncbi:MAG: dephospho-CoA kinase [Planctomycetota bacterium]|jgi:dephospho-CoA kinase
MRRPKVIGITGGIASGKSEVTRILETLGAVVIRADKIGHEVLELPEIQNLLIRQFGQSVFLQKTHTIDRKKVAELVFGASPQALARRRMLEAITHRPIRAEIRKQLDQLLNEKKADAIVLDIPLLLESQWDRICDAVWFIDAPEEIRLQRALDRGWTQEHFRAREASQWSLADKLAKSSCVISNVGTLEELKENLARELRSKLDELLKNQ